MQRRFLLLLLIPLGLLFLLFAGTGYLFSRATGDPGPGEGGWHGPPLAGIAVALIVIALIIRFLRRTAAPVGELLDALEQVAEGDYAARVQPRGPLDTKRMGFAFNAMVEKLESGETQRRRLLADVTHELRTPLSIIRGNVEGMLDGLYPRDELHLAPVLDETRHMARLLDDLQTLANAEAGALLLHKEMVDLPALLGEIVTAFQPSAKEREITLETRFDAMPEIELDPVRIRQVIENLMANSLRYTPKGGLIVIGVRASEFAAEIVILDNGPGVPPDQFPHLFDRFSKSADSGGSGLGLAIARTLIEAHGGSIGAENGNGFGLTIKIRLPARPDQYASRVRV